MNQQQTNLSTTGTNNLKQGVLGATAPLTTATSTTMGQQPINTAYQTYHQQVFHNQPTTTLPTTFVANADQLGAQLISEKIGQPGTAYTSTTFGGMSTGMSTTTMTSTTMASGNFSNVTWPTGYFEDRELVVWESPLYIYFPKGKAGMMHKELFLEGAGKLMEDIVGKPVIARTHRKLFGKKRQRWIFRRDGHIESEMFPGLVMTCEGMNIVLRPRDTMFSQCQRWIVKPHMTDKRYKYICCASNPNMCLEIDPVQQTIASMTKDDKSHSRYGVWLKPISMAPVEANHQLVWFNTHRL